MYPTHDEGMEKRLQGFENRLDSLPAHACYEAARTHSFESQQALTLLLRPVRGRTLRN